jgi:predicted HAD superfamily phosphohydrolase
MGDVPDTTRTSRTGLPGGRPRDLRADPYLKSMLLGLIEDSYLHTGTFTQFAAEVLQVIAYAVTVPVAFTEGFLRAYLSIDRVEEDEEGRIKIIPKADASIEDMIRDVDEITAQVDPGAVFNPVVRAKLDAVHQTSSKAMKWDLNTLSRMDDAQLMEVLREMQAESEAETETGADGGATDYVRARIATIRRNVRQFQARHEAGAGSGSGDPEP